MEEGDDGDPHLTRALCFDSVATPRRGYAVPCGPGVERRLTGLEDQRLALCLDAARTGDGFLWVDEREGELWWMRDEGGSVLARSPSREVRAARSGTLALPRVGEATLQALVDGGKPVRAPESDGDTPRAARSRPAHPAARRPS